MRRYGIICTFLTFSILALSPISAENEKLAQTGFQFLSVVSDARAASLAGAVTTMELGSSSLFFNPAGLAHLSPLFELTSSNNDWIADIKHQTFSFAVNPFKNRIGVFGLSIQTVDYGDIQGTMVWGNEQGYIDTEVFSPSALMVGLGYAKALSAMFSIGGQVKYTKQNLGNSLVEIGDGLDVKNYMTSATAFDFGTIFKTGYKSVKFGMSVRNFSNEIKYEKESFQLPLIFSMGISADLMDFITNLPVIDSALLSIDAAHPRSYPEYINLGLECKLLKSFFLRYGFEQNRDNRSSNFGFGLEKFGVAIDYSYTHFVLFSNVQRFTIRVSI